MDDVWTRLHRARKEDHHEEEGETQELHDLRNQEIEAELPHPQCCDFAKKYLFPYRDVDWRRDEVLNGGVPVWKNSFPEKWDGESMRAFLTILFCPFCGTKLPGLRKKANPPPHLMIENEGHCGNCGERYGRMGYCFCSLPESAYECEG